jgi:hypothetical protein
VGVVQHGFVTSRILSVKKVVKLTVLPMMAFRLLRTLTKLKPKAVYIKKIKNALSTSVLQ